VLCAPANGAAASIAKIGIAIKTKSGLRKDSVRPLERSALMNSPLYYEKLIL
jgi:hypothetical protein